MCLEVRTFVERNKIGDFMTKKLIKTDKKYGDSNRNIG